MPTTFPSKQAGLHSRRTAFCPFEASRILVRHKFCQFLNYFLAFGFIRGFSSALALCLLERLKGVRLEAEKGSQRYMQHLSGNRRRLLQSWTLVLLVSVAHCATVTIEESDNLKAAIDGLASHDILVLEAGTYAGAVACGVQVVDGRNITLVGASGAMSTIIDCQESNRHFDVSGGSTVNLISLTLMKGTSGQGGCVRLAGI